MMQRLSRDIFRLRTRYNNPVDQQQAQMMLYIFVVGVLFSAILSVIYIVIGLIGPAAGLTPVRGFTLMACLLLMVLYFVVQRGYMRLASVVIVGFTLVATLQPAASNLTSYNLYLLAIPLVASGLFMRWQGVLLTSLIIFAVITVVAGSQGLAVETSTVFDIVTITMVLTILIVGFSFALERTVTNLVTDAQHLRSIQGDFVFSSAQTTPQALIADVINLMQLRLSFNVVQIYIVEDGRRIARRYSQSLNRTQVVADDEIEIATGSALMLAVRSGASQQLNADSGTTAQRSHLFLGMEVGLVFPVYFQDTLLALIDLQRGSNDPVAENELYSVDFIAKQLGRALMETRLINNLNASLAEQTHIVEQQQQRLRQLEQAEQRTLISSWVSYLNQRDEHMIGFDLSSGADEPVLSTSTSPELHAVFQAGEISIERDGNMQRVHVPIRLRDEALGAMVFSVPVERQLLGQRHKELIDSVVQRLGLALENKRLFEQTQAQARRESEANSVGNQLLSTTNIETVLRLAADNFNEVLGAVQTQIHLEHDMTPAPEDV